MYNSSHLDSNEQTGPSLDMHRLTANEPRWREEGFQIQPKRVPVSLDLKNSTRPRVHTKPHMDLQLQRIPVLVRQSNQRPVEAGEGDQSENWALSDPGAPTMISPWEDGSGSGIPGMGDALDPVSFAPTKKTMALSVGGLLMFGALAGGLIYFLKSK